MGLDSLLASLKSGVAEVTEMQASNNSAFACNPSRFDRVAEVTDYGSEIHTVTPVTLDGKSEVTAKSAPIKACTHETPVTPKTINCKVGADDTITTSRWWLIKYPDCDPLEVACYPDVTLSDVLKQYPEAEEVEPFSPTIRQPSTPLDFDEETVIREWLTQIDETDNSTVDEVIRQCQVDANARSYFIGVAESYKLQKQLSATAFADDRRTCYQCLNLTGRRCRAAVDSPKSEAV